MRTDEVEMASCAKRSQLGFEWWGSANLLLASPVEKAKSLRGQAIVLHAWFATNCTAEEAWSTWCLFAMQAGQCKRINISHNLSDDPLGMSILIIKGR